MMALDFFLFRESEGKAKEMREKKESWKLQKREEGKEQTERKKMMFGCQIQQTRLINSLPCLQGRSSLVLTKIRNFEDFGNFVE